VNRDTASPATGFAARLEALGRRQIDGLWLRTIVVGSGDGRLALQGATVDPRLVPQYLAALAEEHAFDGVRFDKLAMRQAKREEAPRNSCSSSAHLASISRPRRLASDWFRRLVR